MPHYTSCKNSSATHGDERSCERGLLHAVPTIHAQKLGLGRIKLLAQLHQTTDERYPTTHDFKHVWGMKNAKAGYVFISCVVGAGCM
jgi:hypothetical protein